MKTKLLLITAFLIIFLIRPVSANIVWDKNLFFVAEYISGHTINLPDDKSLCIIINDGSPTLPTFTSTNPNVLVQNSFAPMDGAWYFFFSTKSQGQTKLVFSVTGNEGSNFNFTINVVQRKPGLEPWIE